MAAKKKGKGANDQSARFREVAKEVGAEDAEAFERVFNKLVPPKKKKSKPGH